MAMFLGTISPKIIVTTVPSASPSRERQRDHDAVRHPGGGQRAVDEVGDGGLGEEADGQVGDGDADLGAGELRREGAEGELYAAGALVALGGGALDARPVDGDEARTRRRRRGRRRPRGPARRAAAGGGSRRAPGDQCGRAGTLTSVHGGCGRFLCLGGGEATDYRSVHSFDPQSSCRFGKAAPGHLVWPHIGGASSRTLLVRGEGNGRRCERGPSRSRLLSWSSSSPPSRRSPPTAAPRPRQRTGLGADGADDAGPRPAPPHRRRRPPQPRLRPHRRHARRRPRPHADHAAAAGRPGHGVHRRHLPAPAVLPRARPARDGPVRPEQRRAAQPRRPRRLRGPRPDPGGELVVPRRRLPSPGSSASSSTATAPATNAPPAGRAGTP